MQPSLGANLHEAPIQDRLRLWVVSLPLVTRSVCAALVAVYALELLGLLALHGVCLSPSSTLLHLQVWRLVTAPLSHAGVIHLALNLAAFAPLGASLEQSLGSVRFAHLLLVLAAVGQGAHLALATTLVLLGVRYLLHACALGFSGVLFGLVAVDVALSGAPRRSLLGVASLPAHLYGPALVLLFQFFVPRASLLGHLCGLLAGEAWARGWLARLALPEQALRRAEASAWAARLGRGSAAFVVGPGAEALPVSRAPSSSTGPGASPLGPAAWAGATALWQRLPPHVQAQASAYGRAARVQLAPAERLLREHLQVHLTLSPGASPSGSPPTRGGGGGDGATALGEAAPLLAQGGGGGGGGADGVVSVDVDGPPPPPPRNDGGGGP